MEINTFKLRDGTIVEFALTSQRMENEIANMLTSRCFVRLNGGGWHSINITGWTTFVLQHQGKEVYFVDRSDVEYFITDPSVTCNEHPLANLPEIE